MKVAMFSRSGIGVEGGNSIYLEHLIPGLLKNGYEVVTYNTDFLARRETMFPDVEHVVMPGECVTIEAYLRTAANHVTDAIERDDIDVLHLHCPSSALFMDLIKQSGKKAIVTHHGSQLIRPITSDVLGRALYSEYQFSMRKADAVILHSQIVFDSLKEKGYSNIHYVNIGTQIKPPASADQIKRLGLEPGKYFLFVGKMRKEKGVDLAVEAYKKLDTDWPLVLAGSDSYEPDYYEALIKSARSDPRIRFLGIVLGEKKASLFSHAYALVNPLRIKGLPLVVLEAMSYGRCVLSSDSCAHQEVMRKHSRLFKCNDTERLASGMRELLDDPALVKRLGEGSKAYVQKHHNIDDVADLCDRLYRS
ncbi:glycosyltransferase family 4 protein [Candidatus Woesearchaeota archaeon]|nr:glycosyltransferase family 4 protein [Candidatus Woesearchaeota archaeon]